jgi:DNA-binding transcriptional MerR regulator
MTLHFIINLIHSVGEEQNLARNMKKSGRKIGSAQGLRMKELVAATGVPKSTILHYLNEELLPEPVRTSRNMAYYSPDSVERIIFIKVMQGKYRLSLAIIRQILQSGKVGPELEPLLELRSVIFGQTEDQELMDLEAFCRTTGLSRWGLSTLTART